MYSFDVITFTEQSLKSHPHCSQEKPSFKVGDAETTKVERGAVYFQIAADLGKM